MLMNYQTSPQASPSLEDVETVMAKVPYPAKSIEDFSANEDVEFPKPKRPMSAYSLFFQLERRRIIECSDGDNVDSQHTYTKESIAEFLKNNEVNNDQKPKKRQHRKTHGKISFSELAKTISQRWKNLDDSEVCAFDDYAQLESQRYYSELQVYNMYHKKDDKDAKTNKRKKKEKLLENNGSEKISKKRKRNERKDGEVQVAGIATDRTSDFYDGGDLSVPFGDESLPARTSNSDSPIPYSVQIHHNDISSCYSGPATQPLVSIMVPPKVYPPSHQHQKHIQEDTVQNMNNTQTYPYSDGSQCSDTTGQDSAMSSQRQIERSNRLNNMKQLLMEQKRQIEEKKRSIQARLMIMHPPISVVRPAPVLYSHNRTISAHIMNTPNPAIAESIMMNHQNNNNNNRMMLSTSSPYGNNEGGGGNVFTTLTSPEAAASTHSMIFHSQANSDRVASNYDYDNSRGMNMIQANPIPDYYFQQQYQPNYYCNNTSSNNNNNNNPTSIAPITMSSNTESEMMLMMMMTMESEQQQQQQQQKCYDVNLNNGTYGSNNNNNHNNNEENGQNF